MQSLSSIRGQAIDVGPLYTARTLYGRAREIAALRILSEAAAPVIERIIQQDPTLTARMVAGFDRLVGLAVRLVDQDSGDSLYSDDDHYFFAALARQVADFTGQGELCRLVDEVITLAEPLRGLPPAAVIDRLGPVPDFSQLSADEVDVEVAIPTRNLGLEGATIAAPWFQQPVVVISTRGRWDTRPIPDLVGGVAAAERAIDDKATSVGSLTATPQGGVQSTEDGYYKRFADCDIYYSSVTGAHEIHGEIRRKYLQVNGPALLGLPTTDETTCPDGRGRFNHFSKGSSIYWSPSTGPFYVRGVVRFGWAATGWERGELGYPVQDEQSLGGLYPADNPDMHWSHFQNGIVFGKGSEALPALAATATLQQIQEALGSALERRMPTMETTTAFGLITWTVRPGLYGVDLVGLDDWSYGFNGANPRTLRLKVRGFVSVPIVTDPTFEIDLSLQFSTVWALGSFSFPSYKTVIATLERARISVSGVFSSDIASLIKEAIEKAFTPGDNHPEVQGASLVLGTVPTGANQRGDGWLDFLDVMLMADGSLNIYVNPLPSPFVGPIRRNMAQNQIDSALQSL